MLNSTGAGRHTGAFRCATIPSLVSMARVRLTGAWCGVAGSHPGSTETNNGKRSRLLKASVQTRCRSGADARRSSRLAAQAAANKIVLFHASACVNSHHVVIISGLPFLLWRSTLRDDRAPRGISCLQKNRAGPSSPVPRSRRRMSGSCAPGRNGAPSHVAP